MIKSPTLRMQLAYSSRRVVIPPARQGYEWHGEGRGDGDGGGGGGRAKGLAPIRNNKRHACENTKQR